MKTAVGFLLLTLCIALASGAPPPDPVAAQTPIPSNSTTAVKGTVVDSVSRAPVPGARVTVEPVGLATSTDINGEFSFSSIAWADVPTDPIPSDLDANAKDTIIGRIDVTVEATGFGKWHLTDQYIYPGGPLGLKVLLSGEPTELDYHCYPRAAAGFHSDCPTATNSDVSPQAAAAGSRTIPGLRSSCTGYYSDVTPPSTIRVFDGNSIEVVDFKTYVKESLPHEWIASWKMESLQAGAMAVRNFAWSSVNTGHHGGTYLGQCSDICNTVFCQVWEPGGDDARTNEAVDSIWHADRMTRGNVVDESNYKSGCPIIPDCPGEYDACGQLYLAAAPGYDMSQWGTKACADSGMQWPGIIRQYYFYSAGDPTHAVLLDDYPSATEWEEASNDWHLNVYALNRSGGVRQNNYDAESGTWSGWNVALGGACSSAPAALDYSTTHLWVFCRKSDTSGTIQGKRWNGSSWGSWTTLGFTGFQSGPAATEYLQPGSLPAQGWHLNVYALGWGGNIYENYYDVTQGTWSGWFDKGSPSGGCTSAPAADARTAWELYVFCRGTDGAFWYRMYNGSTWGSWTSIGNSNTWVTSPGATDSIIGGAYIRVYGDGTLGHVWEKTNGGSGWSSWADLDGSCQSAANASDLPTTTYLYVVCRWDPEVFGYWNVGIYYKWFGLGWSAWSSLGAPP